MENPIHVFTDGACQGNGKKSAKAAYAVFFGDEHQLNESGTVDPATNQRAELTAMLCALKKLQQPEFYRKKIYIHSDSMYTINCVTSWCNQWEKNGWKTSNGHPVKNKELIEDTLKALRTVRQNSIIILKHVEAHTKEPSRASPDYQFWYGNFMADAMATRAISD